VFGGRDGQRLNLCVSFHLYPKPSKQTRALKTRMQTCRPLLDR
jgi:hypothetical protein